jgi:Nucleotide modification associated domain 2
MVSAVRGGEPAVVEAAGSPPGSATSPKAALAIHEGAMRPRKLYSYVVEHDNGHAPNPYFGVCTLCRCKFRDHGGKPKNVVELAVEGDWIVGTGGANPKKSTGHGTLVYAMRVDEKLTRQQYYANPRFARKKPADSSYPQTQGDNVQPDSAFEKHEQYALVSKHFFYFGANAVALPKRLAFLEKRGPGFRNRFQPADIDAFVGWLTNNYAPRKHGEPCGSARNSLNCGDSTKSRCKSSC